MAYDNFAYDNENEEIYPLYPKILALMTHVKLGDFILLTPCLQAIQKKCPYLTVAVPDMLWDLYSELDVFEDAIQNSDVETYLQTAQEQPVIINLTYPLLENVNVPDHHLRLDAEVFLQPEHVTQSYIAALKKFFPEFQETFRAHPFLEIDASEDVLAPFHVEALQYFTVHSGSDFPQKNWPTPHFEKTVQLILEKHPKIKCVSFVGPLDQELFIHTPKPERFITVRANLRDVACLLAGSLFHLDNDSGIHHLAGALDIPSITVFGPTAPGTWCSLTQRNFIHWNNTNFELIQPEELLATANYILSTYIHL